MIIAIVSSDDNVKVSSELTRNGFSVTKLASTGGFLMSGNTTLMVGTDDDKVDVAVDIIKQYSQKRTQMVASSASFGMDMSMSIPVEVNVGGATVFILDVEKFMKL